MKVNSLLLFAALALLFAFQKPEVPGTAFPSDLTLPSAPSDTGCIDTVRIVYGLINTDTCASDTLPFPSEEPCCVYRFSAATSPTGVTGLSYSWTLQLLPGGAVQPVGTGSYVNINLPNTSGITVTYRICVTATKPGCPPKTQCREFAFNSKNCTLVWR